MSTTMTPNLDFAGIKQSFIEYMKGQNEFTSYDYEGSGMSVIMDILSKNTHYIAFLANMLSSEMFLDSAQLRESVVSHAKGKGYTPASRQASSAIVDVTVTPSDLVTAPTTLTMEKESKFVCSIDGALYYFITPDLSYASLLNGKYTFVDVELVEGQYVNKRHTITDPRQKIVIPNANVDTSRMTVSVRNSTTDVSSRVFARAESLIGIDNTSTVYYLSENSDGLFEIEFGDGTLGMKLAVGNVVTINYLITNGDAANGAGVFDSVSSIGRYSNVVVNAKSRSYGGSEIEDINSIKFMAPKMNLTQNRAVTPSDYIPITKSIIPQAEDVNSWGGEENATPQYGKVFIAVKMPKGSKLSTSVKESIAQNNLKRFAVGSVTPVLVDADVINVGVYLTVLYKKTLLGIGESELVENIKAKVIEYSDTKLGKFDRRYRNSVMHNIVDSSDSAIQNSFTTKLVLSKNISVESGLVQSLYINFGNNQIKKGSVNISGFRVLDVTTSQNLGQIYYIEDVNGVLKVYRDEDGNKVTVDDDIGTIDYETGVIRVNNFTPIETVDVLCQVSPLNHDIEVLRDEVLEIADTTDVIVTVEGE